MKYRECKIYTEKIEETLGALLTVGIEDAVVNDPKDIDELVNNKQHEYDWDYISKEVLEKKNENPSVVFYLSDDEADGKKADEAGEYLAKLGLGNLEIRMVDDSDWKDKWKQYFKPTKITDRIVVKPSWEEYKASEGELVIEIDPGQAFGTGTHETTSLCIKLMEKMGVQGKLIMDVGCGSGILSIAAGLLGAGDVLGIEIDPKAIPVAFENVMKNGLSDVVEVRLGDLTKGVDYKAHMIVANLMADLVIRLSPDAAKHLLPGGIYITSGILIEKEEIVKNAIEESGFEILEIAEDGEWCAICARLKQD